MNSGDLPASGQGRTGGYQPMTISELAGYLIQTDDAAIRWKLFWEFMEEYRWEPPEAQPPLLTSEPAPVGDERWDALLAAVSEHFLAEHDLAPPDWARSRVLETPWFPARLPVLRADALVHAPAAFRKHGVYLAAHDLEAA